MDYRLTFLPALWLIFIIGCSSDTADDLFINCRYSAPEQIFSEDLPGVNAHHFNIHKMVGEEVLEFNNGSKIKLRQSGCDYLKQEFEYSSPALQEQRMAVYWVEESLGFLKILSNLGPEFISYKGWASAIRQTASEIELDKYIELQEGFYIKINRRRERGDAILMLTLSEKPRG